MPSAVRLPQKASPLNVLGIACETQTPPASLPVIDNASPAGGQGASNPSKISNCHVALASASTASTVASVTPRTVPPVNKIAVLFGERLTQRTKKRSCQHLSNVKHIDLTFAALEGVRITRTLLMTATKPTAASSGPEMNLVVD